MNTTLEHLSWKNTDNIEFYENVPVEVFREFSVIGGFDSGCDIDIILPYIRSCSSVAEVGAGYGRVIELLRKKGFIGDITAIERSKNFHNFMKEQYFDQATLINSDLTDLDMKGQFDAVLFLWSNISEWSLSEQVFILRKLFNWVKVGGHFIFDIIDSEQKPLNSTQSYGQSYRFESEYGTAIGCTPTREQVMSYIKEITPSKYEMVSYETKTNRKRMLFILTR